MKRGTYGFNRSRRRVSAYTVQPDNPPRPDELAAHVYRARVTSSDTQVVASFDVLALDDAQAERFARHRTWTAFAANHHAIGEVVVERHPDASWDRIAAIVRSESYLEMTERRAAHRLQEAIHAL